MAKKKRKGAWTAEFLTPTLRRIGFKKVESESSTSLAGRDLVFVERDRFGFVRYFAVIARDGPLKSRSETRELRALIERAQLGFSTPHMESPGESEHRISGVYLIVNGSVSKKAQEILASKTGTWLHVVDAQRLEMSELLSASVPDHHRASALLWCRHELGYNRDLLLQFQRSLNRVVQEGKRLVGISEKLKVPERSVRTDSLARLVELVASEVHANDLVMLLHCLEIAETIKHSLNRFPLGSIDSSALLPSLEQLNFNVNWFLKNVDVVLRLIDYLRQSGRPDTGAPLSCCPDTEAWLAKKGVPDEEETPGIESSEEAANEAELAHASEVEATLNG